MTRDTVAALPSRGATENVDADEDRADRPAHQQQVDRRAGDLGNRRKLAKGSRIDQDQKKPAGGEGNDGRRDRAADAFAEFGVRRHLNGRKRPDGQGDKSEQQGLKAHDRLSLEIHRNEEAEDGRAPAVEIVAVENPVVAVLARHGQI